ncbi:MAG: hypothetical protein ACK5ML_00535 [Lachnospiraceae bacterium]
MNKKIVIWGAGERGKRIFPHISEQVLAFIDSNKQKQGEECCGRPVISYETFQEVYPECYILISFSFEDEIVDILEQNGNSRYFLMSECPGEFQEPNSRTILKESMIELFQNSGHTAIYGIGLYGYILNEWIKEASGHYVPMIPQKSIEERQWIQRRKDFSEYPYAPSEIIPEFEELFVTTEQELCELEDTYGEAVRVVDAYDISARSSCYHNPELEQYKDIHHGERCFIIATGPSLRMQDLDTLHKNQETCISMNRIWYAFDQTAWRPKYYTILDFRFFKEDSDMLDQIPVEHKFYADVYEPYWKEQPQKEQPQKEQPQSLQSPDQAVAKSGKAHRYHVSYELHSKSLPKFSSDFAQSSYFGCTVTYTCIQLAVYMGFKEIYLLGVDATTPGRYHDKSSHFSEKYLEKSKSDLIVYHDESRMAYQAAEQYTREHGVKIYNATRGGELETFERVNFDSLFTS